MAEDFKTNRTLNYSPARGGWYAGWRLWGLVAFSLCRSFNSGDSSGYLYKGLCFVSKRWGRQGVVFPRRGGAGHRLQGLLISRNQGAHFLLPAVLSSGAASELSKAEHNNRETRRASRRTWPRARACNSSCSPRPSRQPHLQVTTAATRLVWRCGPVDPRIVLHCLQVGTYGVQRKPINQNGSCSLALGCEANGKQRKPRKLV